MTPASPSWADVEKFLGIDGWRQIPAGELHMSAEEIEGLSEEEAVRLVHEHWARRRR